MHAQVAGGATMLDVNMGVPLTDEAELLAAAIKLVQTLTDLPLCIDSSVVEALDAGLAAYEGKALVNSVTGEKERLDAILPLVKQYGAAVIALPNEEEEIPEDPMKRVAITRKIIDIACGTYEIPLADIVIDPLAMPVGADSTYAKKTMDAIAMIRDEFGVNMTLGRGQRVVRHAGPARARLLVPADGDDVRAHLGDHGRPHAADGRGRPGRRPDAGQRRVGRGLDQGAPRQAGRDRVSEPLDRDIYRREGLIDAPTAARRRGRCGRRGQPGRRRHRTGPDLVRARRP